MNTQNTIEAIKVMQAFVDGFPIDCAERHNLKWGETLSPVWNWNNFTYRIKPTSKLRPWTADEVPLGCILKTKSTNSVWLLIGRNNVGEILIAGDNYQSPEWLLREYEHSTDGGKTWLPCGVEEVGK